MRATPRNPSETATANTIVRDRTRSPGASAKSEATRRDAAIDHPGPLPSQSRVDEHGRTNTATKRQQRKRKKKLARSEEKKAETVRKRKELLRPPRTTTPIKLKTTTTTTTMTMKTAAKLIEPKRACLKPIHLRIIGRGRKKAAVEVDTDKERRIGEVVAEIGAETGDASEAETVTTEPPHTERIAVRGKHASVKKSACSRSKWSNSGNFRRG
jgi:hypothetical protein